MSQQCPFYGYRALPEMRKLISNSDNRCALRDGYAPCTMEIDGDEPEPEACTLNGSPTAAAYAKFSRHLFRIHTSADYPD
jgi:hypothetical protein